MSSLAVVVGVLFALQAGLKKCGLVAIVLCRAVMGKLFKEGAKGKGKKL